MITLTSLAMTSLAMSLLAIIAVVALIAGIQLLFIIVFKAYPYKADYKCPHCNACNCTVESAISVANSVMSNCKCNKCNQHFEHHTIVCIQNNEL